MRNIVIALVIGTVCFAALHFSGVLGLGEAIVPGVFVALLAYYGLARKTFKHVERIFTSSASALQSMPPKLDLAVKTLETAYAYAPHQIGVRTQVDSQLGVLHFLQKDFSKAQAPLERSLGFGHWMGAAMLSVIHYKRKNHDEMRKVLEIVTKRGKKESLAWALRAYLMCQIGERDAAQTVLVTGLNRLENDQKLKDALLALQNGKKIKMKAYKEQWYQFHLEKPPAQYQQAAIRPKIGKVARRGR
jgi:tetratricopeptide (TPR) repeat protein